MTNETENKLKSVTIMIDEELHWKMKEISRRKRQQIGPIYESAVKLFLKLPENYTGKENT